MVAHVSCRPFPKECAEYVGRHLVFVECKQARKCSFRLGIEREVI